MNSSSAAALSQRAKRHRHGDAGAATLHLDAIPEPEVDDVDTDLGVDGAARLADVSVACSPVPSGPGRPREPGSVHPAVRATGSG